MSRSRSLPPNADESPWERDSGPHQRACGKVGFVTGPFTQSHSVLTTLPEDRLCTACQRAVSAPKQNKTGRTEEKRKEATAGPPGLQAALVGSVRGSADASRMRRHGRRKPEGGGARPCGKAEEEGFRERGQRARAPRLQGQRASWAPRLHVPGRLEGEGRAGGVRRTQTADVPSAGREGQDGAWSWASVRTSALTWGDKASFGEFRTRRGVAHLAGSSLVFQRTRCGGRGEARETRQPGKEASGVVATRGLGAGGGQQ